MGLPTKLLEYIEVELGDGKIVADDLRFERALSSSLAVSALYISCRIVANEALSRQVFKVVSTWSLIATTRQL
jgi:hypothetical protein